LNRHGNAIPLANFPDLCYTLSTLFKRKIISMKQGIHPTYFEQATITCSCGAVLETGSTTETMHTEICSACHPFYTGKKKFIDATGRVDRFKKLSLKSEEKQALLLKASKAKKESAPKKEKKTAEK